MAATDLADVFIGQPFFDYVQLMSTELTAMWNSGIVRTSPEMSRNLAGAGRVFETPHWNDLADTLANISSDDPTEDSTPEAVTSFETLAIRHKRNQSWASMDIIPSIINDDPMRVVGNRLAAYWSRQFTRLLVSCLKGIDADQDTDESDDMQHLDYADVVSPTASNIFNVNGFLAALQTLGDVSDQLTSIMVHSATFRVMQQLDLIQYSTETFGTPATDRIVSTDGVSPRPSQTTLEIRRFLGHRVIVDDSMWFNAGTNSPEYVSVIFGEGAFGYGEVLPKTPFEFERKPSTGNGEGQDLFYSRREFALHPAGYDNIYTFPADGKSPSNAALEASTAWARKYSRRHIPIAFYKHNI